MKTAQLELEKIIDYFDLQIGLGLELSDRGLGRGQPENLTVIGEIRAYRDAKEKCEGLLEVITGIYPESQLEDISK